MARWGVEADDIMMFAWHHEVEVEVMVLWTFMIACDILHGAFWDTVLNVNTTFGPTFSGHEPLAMRRFSIQVAKIPGNCIGPK